MIKYFETLSDFWQFVIWTTFGFIFFVIAIIFILYFFGDKELKNGEIETMDYRNPKY